MMTMYDGTRSRLRAFRRSSRVGGSPGGGARVMEMDFLLSGESG
jgi:hypothetical protein